MIAFRLDEKGGALMILPLMETNVYAVKGRVLVVGSCLP